MKGKKVHVAVRRPVTLLNILKPFAIVDSLRRNTYLI